MYIARQKRRENIAEYILYLWQLEDLLRALQFSPEAVWSQLVEPSGGSTPARQEQFFWYMEMIGLLRSEDKAEKGHLDHTLHLIADLQNLHEQLLRSPAGERYRELFGRLAAELPRLRGLLGRPEVSDIELCFRALYATMLYRIKRDKKSGQAIEDVLELVSPVVAELASVYGRVERGELDLYGEPESRLER